MVPTSDAARAEHRAAEILERVADAHIVFDRELRYVTMNAAAERSMRRTRAELIGQTLVETFPSAAQSETMRQYRRVMAERVEVHFAEHYVGDGLDLHIEVDAYPTDEGGVAVFWRDVSPRVRAETALRASEARLKRLLDIEGVGIMIFDATGTLIGSNDAFVRMTGYSRETVEARVLTWRTMTPAEYVTKSEAQMMVLGRTGRIGPYEKEYILADGSRSWMLFAGAALGDGTVAEYCIDISDRHRAEAALRASEAKYRTLFESMDDGFCIIEVIFDEANRPVDYRFVETNPAFVQQTGLENAVGRTIQELAPGLEAHWFETYGKVALSGEPAHFEARAEALGRWYDVSAVRVGEPKDHRVAVFFADRTAAKAAEREREQLLGALELERSRLATVFARSPSILALIRGRDRILELANDAYLNLIGRRDVIGKPLLDAVPELRGQGFDALLDGVVETGEPYVGRAVPIKVVTGEGLPAEERFFDFVYLPVTEVDGTRSGVIAHGNDITDQVRARREAERARAEAEAANRAKSDFLAVMSHELRTPLNAIGGYAELMEMGIRGAVTPQQADDLRRIQASQRHLLRLVNEVLNYARIETGTVHYELTSVPLALVIASVEPLVAPQLAMKRLAYETMTREPAPIARADREKVRQILLNLLSNAVKFTDRGGRVDVSCEMAGDRVRVEVRDTGIGIAPNELERIFEPFVQVNSTLTRTQEGTGLGLAISRDLARGMGGELTAESEIGVGSTFTLTLPAE